MTLSNETPARPGTNQARETPAGGRRGATAAQLRDDIDAGRTGDKVAAFDPAAAPLGTDEEAAGSPVEPGLIARSRREQQGVASDAAIGRAEALARRWTVVGAILLTVIVALIAIYLAI